MSETPILDEDFEEFTEEESESFKSLIVIGSLSKTYKVFGHDIHLRTLTVDEDLQVGLLLKRFLDSSAFQRAMRTIIVAAAIRSIDGVPLIQSLSPNDTNETNAVSLKFDKIKLYYPPVIDEIYNHFTELEANLLPVLSRLGKKFA